MTKLERQAGSQAPFINDVELTASAVELNAAAAVGVLLGTVAVAADVLPIPVTHWHVAKTTGADAEALSLANGVPGQILTIDLTVDGGGTGTLTPVTSTGWATAVFADAGDSLTVRFIDGTVGWIVLAAFGLTAQPTLT